MWRGVVLTLALVASVSPQAEAQLEGYKIYEVLPKTTAACELLRTLAQQTENYDFLSLSRMPGRPARVLLSDELEAGFRELLANNSIAHELLNANVGQTIAAELQLNRLQRKLAPITGAGRLSTERYYNHAEIIKYIDDLAVRYPARVFVKTVGWSYEKRVLKTITITNGDRRANKKVIFVDGGFHAREWISPATALYVIDQLVENFAENAELLQDYDWVILPLINADGYEHTQTGTLPRFWRKTRQPYKAGSQTCYGADPNRNFDFHWNEEGSSSSPCSSNYAGPKAFSEPETVVVRDLMHTLSSRGIMYLTLHAYGNYLLYPWGWTSDLPDTWKDLDDVARAGADAIREATGTEYTYGSSTNVLYIAAGASDDYGFYAGFNISITMELSGGGISGFNPPASLIHEFVTEAWIGIRAMAQKVIEKY